MHVITDNPEDQHYILEDGTVAHNLKAGCPAADMWVDQTHQVSDVWVGMPLDCLKGHELDFVKELDHEEHEVHYFEQNEAVCFRFVTENGAAVVVSATTPVPTRESIEAGELHRAFMVRSGSHVVTDVGNGPEWSMIVETECVGMRPIVHVDVGGRTFASGEVPGKYIYTHNLLALT
jgi:hypothetical protein